MYVIYAENPLPFAEGWGGSKNAENPLDWRGARRLEGVEGVEPGCDGSNRSGKRREDASLLVMGDGFHQNVGV